MNCPTLVLTCAAIVGLLPPVASASGHSDVNYRELKYEVELALDTGDSESVIRRLRTVAWDSLPTPEVLMLFVSAHDDADFFARLAPSLKVYPISLQFAHGYFDALRARIPQAEKRFMALANKPTTLAWGAIGLAELGLLTDDVSLIEAGSSKLSSAVRDRHERWLRALAVVYEAQLMARRRKSLDAEALLQANVAYVDEYTYCTFMLSGAVDRLEVEKIARLKKQCKRFKAPLYALEENRATYVEKGSKVAEQDLRTMRKRWPKSTEISRNLLELRILNASMRERSEILREYERLALSEPLFAPAVLRYANLVLDYGGNPEEVLPILDRLGNGARRFTSHVMLRAKIAIRLGQFDDANILLRDAVQRAPANIDVLELIAHLGQRTGNVEQTIDSLNGILEIQPRNQDVLFRAIELSANHNKCGIAHEMLKRLSALSKPRVALVDAAKEQVQKQCAK